MVEYCSLRQITCDEDYKVTVFKKESRIRMKVAVNSL
jgi:hypothetical protein